MSKNKIQQPSVLIPYPGPCKNSQSHDIFFYLRPETNGVRTESTLLRVIQKSEYKDKIEMIYLANLPGSFIVRNHIVEEHYSVKYYFSKHGKKSFTPHMIEEFESYFHTDFAHSAIVGSFEALSVLGTTEEELFKHWVPVSDLLVIDGQTIKKIENVFVVNYDIPALLHKNNSSTDIAVMIFRSTLPSAIFQQMVREMENALVREEILSPQVPFSHAFHYSKSPFEQILDAIGYLYAPDGSHVHLENVSFCCYLIERGLTPAEIAGCIRYPIMQFRSEHGEIIEQDLLYYTFEDSYHDAYCKLFQSISQVHIDYGGASSIWNVV